MGKEQPNQPNQKETLAAVEKPKPWGLLVTPAMDQLLKHKHVLTTLEERYPMSEESHEVETPSSLVAFLGDKCTYNYVVPDPEVASYLKQCHFHSLDGTKRVEIASTMYTSISNPNKEHENSSISFHEETDTDGVKTDRSIHLRENNSLTQYFSITNPVKRSAILHLNPPQGYNDFLQKISLKKRSLRSFHVNDTKPGISDRVIMRFQKAARMLTDGGIEYYVADPNSEESWSSDTPLSMQDITQFFPDDLKALTKKLDAKCEARLGQFADELKTTFPPDKDYLSERDITRFAQSRGFSLRWLPTVRHQLAGTLTGKDQKKRLLLTLASGKKIEGKASADFCEAYDGFLEEMGK